MSTLAKTEPERGGRSRQVLRWSLGTLAMGLLVTGAMVGILFGEVSIGVLIFVAAFFPVALVTYLETEDKAVSRVLIFVAVLTAVLEIGLLLIGI